MKGELVYKLQLYYKDEYIRLFQGDCLEVMDRLIEKGVKFDAIITDPPYGTTACKWDSIIPLDEMWKRLKLIRYDKTPIILFGSEPFTSNLRLSNIEEYKYDWYWYKNKPSGAMTAKIQPMKAIENLSVFYKSPPIYTPQMKERTEAELKRLSKKSVYTCSTEIDNRKWGKSGNRDDNKLKYPNNVLEIKTVFNRSKEKVAHSTQKPVELMEYLIKTYTNENELILDFTCGSGTTLLAARNLKRKCIGIELEEKYCEIAKNRLTA
jgi:DNA modification methylase